MYYAVWHTSEEYCIGVATATFILGKYTPHSTLIVRPRVACDYGTISPNPITVDEENYIVYKNNTGHEKYIYLQRMGQNDTQPLEGIPPYKPNHATKEEYDAEGPVIVMNPTNDHYVLLFVAGYYKNTSYSIAYVSPLTLMPEEEGKGYPRKGVSLATGKTNGMQLYAPGEPDFVRGRHMSFMTWAGDHYGKRVMRTANTT